MSWKFTSKSIRNYLIYWKNRQSNEWTILYPSINYVNYSHSSLNRIGYIFHPRVIMKFSQKLYYLNLHPHVLSWTEWKLNFKSYDQFPVHPNIQ